MNYYIFQDWERNKGYFKGRLILILFRTACWVRRSNILIISLFCWYLLFYRFFVEWVLGTELSWNLCAGKGLRIYHGQSLIVNGDAKIGLNCTLRHCTTIGNKADTDSRCPVIGDNVDIGANVCILGNITIGDNVTIGAGSVVIKSFPSDCVIAGNPARIIKHLT